MMIRPIRFVGGPFHGRTLNVHYDCLRYVAPVRCGLKWAVYSHVPVQIAAPTDHTLIFEFDGLF